MEGINVEGLGFILHIKQDLLNGNPYAWALFGIVLFAFLWRTNQDLMRKILHFIKNIFVKEKKHIHSKSVMEAIISEVAIAWSTEYSSDMGRNALYRWIVSHMFNLLKGGIEGFYLEYTSGKIAGETFCESSKHKILLHKLVTQFSIDLEEELRKNEWPEQKVSFMKETTTKWLADHMTLFNRYINICYLPRQYLQNWLWLIGEILTTSDKYGMNFNGEIYNLKYNGIKIGH